MVLFILSYSVASFSSSPRELSRLVRRSLSVFVIVFTLSSVVLTLFMVAATSRFFKFSVICSVFSPIRSMRSVSRGISLPSSLFICAVVYLRFSVMSRVLRSVAVSAGSASMALRE